jgi:hypothetical protein
VTFEEAKKKVMAALFWIEYDESTKDWRSMITQQKATLTFDPDTWSWAGAVIDEMARSDWGFQVDGNRQGFTVRFMRGEKRHEFFSTNFAEAAFRAAIASIEPANG